MTYELHLPADFGDYAWEVEAKGWFAADVTAPGGGTHRVTFYDPGRLRQDIEDDLAAGRPVSIARLIVVERVAADHMARAVARLPDAFFA
ncbi:hypothetical protein [Jiangella sp. DSM 45060]|uniref:hypothetical protein n=1 Tax=Jiangella sp. DSM 45060 TaxID=1798224 RepID=UPI00087DBCFD|nr:hypothetical protein [Jiangella sp. DSM 45060]SDS80870.1 hypothetical protein SAMN04515669_1980 [Jiangella sp. DSM 45060]